MGATSYLIGYAHVSLMLQFSPGAVSLRFVQESSVAFSTRQCKRGYSAILWLLADPEPSIPPDVALSFKSSDFRFFILVLKVQT